MQATGRFSLAVPSTLERRYHLGVDSAVDQFVSDGVQLNLDYGLYGGGVAPDQPGVRTERLPGDGRTLRWTVQAANATDTQFRYTFTGRLSDPEQSPSDSPYPPSPGPGLSLSMHCRTAELCEIGPMIARSVRFGAGRPLSERLAFLRSSAPVAEGRDPLQGPMIVDSDGCLRLTDPQGVPGPVLVWPSTARLETVGPNLVITGGVGRPMQVADGAGGYFFLRGRGMSTADEAGLVSPAPPACAGRAFAVATFSIEGLPGAGVRGEQNALRPPVLDTAQNVFVVTYRQGPRFDPTKGFENEGVREHIRHFQALGDRLVAAGTVQQTGDDLLGYVILRQSDQATAEAWLSRDPAIRAGTMSAQLRRWGVDEIKGWKRGAAADAGRGSGLSGGAAALSAAGGTRLGEGPAQPTGPPVARR